MQRFLGSHPSDANADVTVFPLLCAGAVWRTWKVACPRKCRWSSSARTQRFRPPSMTGSKPQGRSVSTQRTRACGWSGPRARRGYMQTSTIRWVILWVIQRFLRRKALKVSRVWGHRLSVLIFKKDVAGHWFVPKGRRAYTENSACDVSTFPHARMTRSA